MRVACLVDTTRCIGCRSCQVACKQSHGLKAEYTKFFADAGGYQNPPRYSPYTRTYVSYHELPDDKDGMKWIFVKHQCMHCREMPCALVCAPGVFRLTESGVVAVNASECIGCAACTDACPFEAPVVDYWDVKTPHIRKCSFCFERQQTRIEQARIDGKPLSGASLARLEKSLTGPACAKACPTGAISFGRRADLLAEARRRIAAAPRKYVDHIYGEKELGGLGWLYLASVPFEKLGFPTEFEPPDAFEQMGTRQSDREAASIG